MVSSISSTALPLLLLLNIYNHNNMASADTCEGNDPLWCPSGSCRNGEKDYSNLLGIGPNDSGLLTTSIRGMYCECPDDTASSSYGMSGIHCQTTFEKCSDDTICFNGGFCEHNSENYSRYHCGCPQDDHDDAENGGKVFAGRACEIQAMERDFCSSHDSYFDFVGSRWFCVNGGRCIDDEDDLAKKCDCAEGFVGLHCEYDKTQFDECNLQCSNGGTCNKGAKDISKYIDYGIDVDHFLGGSNVNGEHCICPDGYSGVTCEVKDVKHCGSGVCFNGGLCVETIGLDGSMKDYHCECNQFEHTNVAGEFCEHPEVRFCPAPEGHRQDEYYCANGGNCPLGEPHEPCTECDKGWEGPRCEKRIRTNTKDKYGNDSIDLTPRSECDLECQNGGTCFFGDHPITNTEQFDLVPGLEFLQDNKHCRCPDGYIGLKCEMRYERCGAGEHYCLHGSGCVPDNDEFTCDCNEVSTELVAYAGHYCEHTATEFCQGPGAGKHSFCTNHGTCRGQVGLGSDHVGCDCQEGWAGEYCEYKVEQLRTNGVATKAFIGFLSILLLNTVVFSIYACTRKSRMERNAYESAADHEMIANPYGDEHDDSSDSDDDEYELKEVTII